MNLTRVTTFKDASNLVTYTVSLYVLILAKYTACWISQIFVGHIKTSEDHQKTEYGDLESRKSETSEGCLHDKQFNIGFIGNPSEISVGVKSNNNLL